MKTNLFVMTAALFLATLVTGCAELDNNRAYSKLTQLSFDVIGKDGTQTEDLKDTLSLGGGKLPYSEYDGRYQYKSGYTKDFRITAYGSDRVRLTIDIPEYDEPGLYLGRVRYQPKYPASEFKTHIQPCQVLIEADGNGLFACEKLVNDKGERISIDNGKFKIIFGVPDKL